MTTLKVNLSPQLQSTLSQTGVNAYAVYFKDGTAFWTTLVNDGSVAGSGTVDIALPGTFVGGKVYFLIQSEDSGDPHDLTSEITEESQINFGNAQALDFRYDSFEVTLQNGANDVGNLTSVNGFGLPMQLSVTYADGTTSTRGYDISGTDMFSALGGVGNSSPLYTYSGGPLAGQTRAAVSPSEALAANPNLPAFSASDWDAYVGSLKVADTGVAISGFFNGAPDANGVWHNAGFYSYSLEWDADAGVFWLSPAENSEIQGYIRITPDDLANSIYSTLGDVGIYTSKTDAEPYRILDNAAFATGDDSMNSGENNQWGAILAQFLTGFTGGFYGTAGGASLNPLVTDPIDLDQNWNWDPSYAFGRNLVSGQPEFFDAYSEVFYFNSNSYGSGYSDALMRQYAEGGPLIPVTNPGTSQNVSEIVLTIYDDGETPAGYETPVIYNYIAAPGGGYAAVGTALSDNSVKLNLANAGMVLDDDTPISLDLMVDWNGGSPIWQTVTFDAPDGVSPWQRWDLSWDGSAWSAVLQDGTDQGPGQLLINHFPTGGTGTYWYRLNVGAGDDLKTYNLYLETDGSSPSPFLNPAFAGQAGSLSVDGLATIAPSASSATTIPTFTVNFLYGATVTLDPDLLVRDASITVHGAPSAPVAGTLVGGDFHALDGQVNLVSNAITTTQAEIAFGWTGLNDSTANTASWISGYTNKIGALNYAQVSFLQDGQPVLSPVTARADIDGQWQTQAQPLGNGTYNVTMTEYLKSDPTFTTPVGPASGTLTLTVDTPELDLGVAGGGSALALMAGGPDDPPGNWVDLDMIGAWAEPGTTLVLYATNAQGDLVHRDGLDGGTVATLEEATLGSLGALHNDAGWLLLTGEQSVYLESGLELRFAVMNGDGEVDMDPDVRLIPRPGGEFLVRVDDFILHAETDNDLSDHAVLAHAQRATGHEVLYLEQGATLDVDVFGSSGNVNTLGLVRLDLDPLSGDWSVDGVPYGDTDAFREAVKHGLDDGFLLTRGGDFAVSETWTVAGQTGFYAPVLLSPTGDVFVIGDGNAGGNEHVRSFGHNSFGFEDLTEAQGADFDYNDVFVRLSPVDADQGGEDLAAFLVQTHNAWEWVADRLPGLALLEDAFDFGALSSTTTAAFAPDDQPAGLTGPGGWPSGEALDLPPVIETAVEQIGSFVSGLAEQFGWSGEHDLV